jgi:hypothetical protein
MFFSIRPEFCAKSHTYSQTPGCTIAREKELSEFEIGTLESTEVSSNLFKGESCGQTYITAGACFDVRELVVGISRWKHRGNRERLYGRGYSAGEDYADEHGNQCQTNHLD